MILMSFGPKSFKNLVSGPSGVRFLHHNQKPTRPLQRLRSSQQVRKIHGFWRPHRQCSFGRWLGRLWSRLQVLVECQFHGCLAEGWCRLVVFSVPQVIRDASSSNDVVIAEGFQLMHSANVQSQLTTCYCLELPREEARQRRTQPRDPKLNPNPLSKADFDDLAWPAHERYWAQNVTPLAKDGRVAVLPSPGSADDVTDIVRSITANMGISTT